MNIFNRRKRTIFLLAGFVSTLILVGFENPIIAQASIEDAMSDLGCNTLKECDLFCDLPENNSSSKCNAYFVFQEQRSELEVVMTFRLDYCMTTEACNTYCETHGDLDCREYYGLQNDLAGLGKHIDRMRKAEQAFLAGGGPNGCNSDESCGLYCTELSAKGYTETAECNSFVLDGYEITYPYPSILNSHIVAAEALKKGVENNIPLPKQCLPGYVQGHLGCSSYCTLDNAAPDCLEYIKKTGLLSSTDIVILDLKNRGETPGECRTLRECNNYCQNWAAIDECLTFAGKYGLIVTSEELVLYRKLAPLIKTDQVPRFGQYGTSRCATVGMCKAVCDLPENYTQCTELAEKLKLAEEEVPPEDQPLVDAIENGEAPGGCKDEVTCRNYCENINNLGECVDFVEKFDLATLEEIQDMRQLVAAQEAGVPLPGDCTTEESCLEYCEAPSHTVECVNFAVAAGYITEDDAAQAKKFAPLIARGETPGECATKDQCEAYCEEGAHIEECLDFAIEHKLFPPEELEIMRKIRPFIEAGTMPGGCKSKPECEAYCENSDHATECIEIGLATGMIKPEEVEMIKKSGGKGPGNCRSREACEAFCIKPENQKECMDFAVKIGLMTQEEAEQAQSAGDMSQCFAEADDKINACFITNLGVDLFEQMKAGKMPYDMAIMEKMRRAKACVQQYSDKAADQLGGLLKALPVANACIATELGPDFLGRLRKMTIPCSQMKGISGKMEACFQKGMSALFEECAAKDCSEVQSCMTNVGKSLTSIAGQPEGGDHPESQKQEMPQVLQDKLNSCGFNFDTKTCLAKATCKEFFSCLNPSENKNLQQGGDGEQQESPREIKERMDFCQKELIEIMKGEAQEKVNTCLALASCSEFDACMKSLQQSADEQSGQQQQQGQQEQDAPDPRVMAKVQACQEEIQKAKTSVCLALSCSEFDACMQSLQQGGGDQTGQQQQQGEGTLDPAVMTKIQACQQEKINACLAKSCDEFQGCLNSLGGGGEGGEQQQGAPDPAVQAKFMSCFPPPPQGSGLLRYSPFAAILNFLLGPLK